MSKKKHKPSKASVAVIEAKIVPPAKKKLSALMDDDDAPKIEYKGKAPRLLKLLDEDDTPNAFPAVVSAAVRGQQFEEKLGKAAEGFLETKKPKKEAPAPQLIVVRQVETPNDFFNVQTLGGVRVSIIDRLGADYKDLLCYNWDMKVIMHLKREDLVPPALVDRVVQFLRNEIRQDKQ